MDEVRHVTKKLQDHRLAEAQLDLVNSTSTLQVRARIYYYSLLRHKEAHDKP